MTFFYEDQAYPGDDPMEVARQMGLTEEEALALLAGESAGPASFDPNMLAEMVGQQYNPYQGYPTKQVSDQVWDVYGPTPDYLIAQQFGMLYPDADRFSTDAFFGADPMLRGPLAEGLAHAEGDPIEAYNYLQGSGEGADGEPGFQDRLRKQIGRTEWEALADQGNLASLAAMTSEEEDQAGVDYYNRGLEELLAQGSPSAQRNMGMYDYIAERQGGRPYAGAGTTPFDQGLDPLAQLAAGPQYAGGQVDPQIEMIRRLGEDQQDLNRLTMDDEGQVVGDVKGRRFAIADPVSRRALQQVIMERSGRLADQRRTAQGERSQPRRGFMDFLFGRGAGRPKSSRPQVNRRILEQYGN